MVGGQDAECGDQGEEEEDLGPGETSEASSDLGRLLMTDSKVELSMAMTQAGEAVDVREIQVFTQKGLYTRRIMEEMGLGELNREITDLRDSGSIPDRRLGQALRQRREWLRRAPLPYVERSSVRYVSRFESTLPKAHGTGGVGGSIALLGDRWPRSQWVVGT